MKVEAGWTDVMLFMCFILEDKRIKNKTLAVKWLFTVSAQK